MARDRDEDLDDDEAPRARKPRRRDDEDYEDPEDRPRKKGDVTGGVIPYKNGMALASYYCGVFALIPCLGLILGPISIILAILGLVYAKKHPESRGQVHCFVGILLSVLSIGYHVALMTMGFLSGR
jgi:hypothetical protein